MNYKLIDSVIYTDATAQRIPARFMKEDLRGAFVAGYLCQVAQMPKATFESPELQAAFSAGLTVGTKLSASIDNKIESSVPELKKSLGNEAYKGNVKPVVYGAPKVSKHRMGKSAPNGLVPMEEVRPEQWNKGLSMFEEEFDCPGDLLKK